MALRRCGIPSNVPVSFNKVDIVDLTVCNELATRGNLVASTILVGNLFASHRFRTSTFEAEKGKFKIVKVWSELNVSGNSRFSKPLRADADGIFRKDLYVYGNIWQVTGNRETLIAANGTISDTIVNGNLLVRGSLTVEGDSFGKNLRLTDELRSNTVLTSSLVALDIDARNAYLDDLEVSGDAEFLGNLIISGNVQGSLDASIIKTGVIPVIRGGTGNMQHTKNALLVGNGADPLFSADGITYDPINASLSVSGNLFVGGFLLSNGSIYTREGFEILGQSGLIHGNGSGIYSLNASNVDTGILSVSHGGTGTDSLIKGSLLVGNGSDRVEAFTQLVWNSQTTTLSVHGNLVVDGVIDTNLSIEDITDGVLRVHYGGTGRDAHLDNKVLIGNGTSPLTSADHMHYESDTGFVGLGTNSPTSRLTVDGTTTSSFFSGNGRFLHSIPASNIETDTSSRLLFGDGGIRSADALTWNNATSSLYIQQPTDESEFVVSRKVPFLLADESMAYGNAGLVISSSTLENDTEMRIKNDSVSLKLGVLSNLVHPQTAFISTNDNGNLIITTKGLHAASIPELTPEKPSIWINSSDSNGWVGVNTDNPRSTLDCSGLLTANAINCVGPGTIAGDGSTLSNLSASNIATGILVVPHGGTGNSYFEPNKVVVGDGADPMYSATNLHYDPATGYVGIGGIPNQPFSVFGDTHFDNNVYVNGNLTINGTTTEVRRQISNVDSNYIILNSNLSPTETLLVPDSGIVVNRGQLGNAYLIFDEAAGRWEATQSIGQVSAAKALARYENGIVDGSVPFWDDTLKVFNYTPGEFVFSGGYLGIGTSPLAPYRLNASGGIRTTTGFHGPGSEITNLDASKVTQGVLPVNYGGTGTITHSVDRLIVGDGQQSMYSASGLIYNRNSDSIGIKGSPVSGNGLSVFGNAFISNNATIRGGLVIGGNIVPTGNGVQDLGTPESRWRDLFLAGNSIFLGDSVLRSENSTGILTYTDKIGRVRKIIEQDGATISNVNASNITTGVLSVMNGGTGTFVIPTNELLVGNGSGPISGTTLKYDPERGSLGIKKIPTAELDVNGDIRFSGYVYRGLEKIQFPWKYTISETTAYITDDLNVAIGTQDDVSNKLFVSGDIYATSDIISRSDGRFKTDLRIIENALEKIKKVNGYTYNMVDDNTDQRHMGFVAQELEVVAPECVSTQSKTGIKGVSYGNFSAMIVEALKELSRDVDSIKRALNL